MRKHSTDETKTVFQSSLDEEEGKKIRSNLGLGQPYQKKEEEEEEDVCCCWLFRFGHSNSYCGRSFVQ